MFPFYIMEAINILTDLRCGVETNQVHRLERKAAQQRLLKLTRQRIKKTISGSFLHVFLAFVSTMLYIRFTEEKHIGPYRVCVQYNVTLNCWALSNIRCYYNIFVR